MVALGQSVGLLGSVLVGLGWPVVGPSLIGRSSADERYRQLIVSLWARASVAMVVVPLIIVVLGYIFPGGWILLWVAVASTLLGGTSSWYFLGADEPRSLFWRDAVVRSLGLALGLVAVAFTGAGEWFALSIVAGLVVSIALTVQRSRIDTSGPYRPKPSEVYNSIRSQAKGLSANALFVVLASVALPVTAVAGGPLFLIYAVIDKVQKQLTTLALPVAQLITGKMAGSLSQGVEPFLVAEKMFRSTMLSGALLSIVMIPLGPFAVKVMSVGAVHVNVPEQMALAGVVGLAFIAQGLPTAVLAPINKLRYSVIGMSLAIAGGIPAILLCRNQGLGTLLSILCLMYLVPILFGYIGFRSGKRNSSTI